MSYPSPEDMAQLETILDRINGRGSRRFTLAGLLAEWRALVEKVEAGYDDTIYEYTNDLYVRRALDEVMEGAPVVSGWISDELRPVDDRFRVATRPARHGLPGLPEDVPDLLQRVPLRPGRELKGDLAD